MDHLHHVIRSLRDTKAPRRDHLAVFREFLSHLDRIGRRAPRARSRKASAKASARRGG